MQCINGGFSSTKISSLLLLPLVFKLCVWCLSSFMTYPLYGLPKFCSIVDVPYDCSAEADFLYSLIVKAKFENNRFQKPKKQPKASTQNVDWF